MNESPISNSELGISTKEQNRFAIRALETLASRLREAQDSEDDAYIEKVRKTLFTHTNIKKLLETCNVVETDSLEDIVQKIEEKKADLIVRPEETREVSETIPANDNTREQIMIVQDELNELYRQRNDNDDFVEAEKTKVSGALAKLAVFASDINGSEPVEVQRTKDGTVEVIFASDVSEGETLNKEAEDIRNSKDRIAEYENKISEITGPEKSGFLKKLFPGNSSGINPEVTEWEGKIMRTQEELMGKITHYEARNERLLARMHNKNEALDTPLQINGLDTFSGSWQTLLENLKKGSDIFLENLEKSSTQYDQAIETLETKIRVLEEKAP